MIAKFSLRKTRARASTVAGCLTEKMLEAALAAVADNQWNKAASAEWVCSIKPRHILAMYRSDYSSFCVTGSISHSRLACVCHICVRVAVAGMLIYIMLPLRRAWPGIQWSGTPRSPSRARRYGCTAREILHQTLQRKTGTHPWGSLHLNDKRWRHTQVHFYTEKVLCVGFLEKSICQLLPLPAGRPHISH